MRRINKKGLTSVELVITFSIVAVLSVVLFNSVIGFFNKNTIEAYKLDLFTYKDLLNRDIQKDIVEMGLEDVTFNTTTAGNTNNDNTKYVTTSNITFSFTDGSTKDLIIKSRDVAGLLEANEDASVIAELINLKSITSIIYDDEDYKVPNLGEREYKDSGIFFPNLTISNIKTTISNSIFTLEINFAHNELEEPYDLIVTVPVNYDEFVMNYDRSDAVKMKAFDATGGWYDAMFTGYDGATFTPKFELEGVLFEKGIDQAAYDNATNKWDYSENNDGTILAYIDSTNVLHIQSNNRILAPESIQNMFRSFTTLKTIEFNGIFDTRDVTNMGGVFMDCSAIEHLDVSTLNTDKTTYMYGMFRQMDNIINLDLSTFNVTNVTNAYAMFAYNYKMETLDLTGFNPHLITNMQSFFLHCYKLKSLDISSWDTSNVENIQSTFRGLTSMTTLDLSKNDFSGVLTDVSYNIAATFAENTTLNTVYVRNTADKAILEKTNSRPAGLTFVVK